MTTDEIRRALLDALVEQGGQAWTLYSGVLGRMAADEIAALWRQAAGEADRRQVRQSVRRRMTGRELATEATIQAAIIRGLTAAKRERRRIAADVLWRVLLSVIGAAASASAGLLLRR